MQERTFFYTLIVIVSLTAGMVLGAYGGHWYGDMEGYDRGYKAGYSTGLGYYEGDGTSSHDVMPYGWWFSWNNEESYKVVDQWWVAFDISLTWKFNPKVQAEHSWIENRDFDFIGNSTYRFENGTIWYTSPTNETITDIEVIRAYAWVGDRPEDTLIEVDNFVYGIEYLNATMFKYEAGIWFTPREEKVKWTIIPSKLE
jgi:hypothetical protein